MIKVAFCFGFPCVTSFSDNILFVSILIFYLFPYYFTSHDVSVDLCKKNLIWQVFHRMEVIFCDRSKM